MKTQILTVLAIIGLTLSSFAQKGERAENREAQKAEKVAFITERLALTPEESKNFWPVYDKRDEEKRAAMKTFKGDKGKAKKKIEEMTDEEVKALLNKSLEKRQAELDMQKKYNEKFLSVLPPKKVAKLYHAEREFRKTKKGEHHENKEKK